MITVIDNYNEGALEMYEGMSLAEATGQFVLESNQLVNDFMMDILLTEHAYLYENGHEIEYTTLGEANDNGLSFLDKVNNLIQNAKTLFLKIVNNIIAFITEKSTQVIAWFRKMGMDKSKVKKAFANNANEEVEGSKGVLTASTGLNAIVDNAEKFFIRASNINQMTDDDVISSGEFYELFEENTDIFEEVKLPAAKFADGVIYVIFGSDKVISSIKKIYKKSVDSLENLKKRTAAKKSLDAETINDNLSLIRSAIMTDTYVLKDCSKIYSKLMKEAIDIAKDIIKMGKPDKDKKDDEEDDEDDGSDTGLDRSQLREACEYILSALEESDNEDDGRFFRV